MFVSTIIATIARPTLSNAVNSVLEQGLTSGDLEVIVVNDSGQPLPEAEWQSDSRVRVISTNRNERSVARNTGAAIARGNYLHFLDDDDCLLPGALEYFRQLSTTSRAAWLYGAYEVENRERDSVSILSPSLTGNILAHLIAGESIPFQASLYRRETFFKAGMFDPNVWICEDLDLCRRIALLENVASMPAAVARIRCGRTGSSGNWALFATNERLTCDKVLREPGAWSRLRDSAASHYWRGRVTRQYLALVLWNLKRRDPFAAASRGLSGLALAGYRVLTPGFWRGLNRSR